MIHLYDVVVLYVRALIDPLALRNRLITVVLEEMNKARPRCALRVPQPPKLVHQQLRAQEASPLARASRARDAVESRHQQRRPQSLVGATATQPRRDPQLNAAAFSSRRPKRAQPGEALQSATDATHSPSLA